MRLLLLWLLFVATAATAQESPDVRGNQLRQLVNRYAGGDTTVLPAIRELLAGSRSSQMQGQALSDTLLSLADHWSRKNLYHAAIRAELLGWEHTSKMNDRQRTASHLVGLAYNYACLDYPDSTQYFLNLLKQVPVTDWSNYARVSFGNVNAIMAQSKGNYLEAIEHYWKTLELDGLADGQKAVIQANLANLFNELGHHRRSIDYSNQALTVYRQQNDSAGLGNVHTNLGLSWMYLDSLGKAAFHHLEAIRYSNTNTFGQARGLANYANVLRRQGRLQEALAAADSSIQICQRLNIPFGVALNRVNRANILLDMKQPGEAIRQLAEAGHYPFVHSALVRTEICSLYYEAHKALGNQSEAFNFLRQYVALKDSTERTGAERVVLEWEESIIRAGKDRQLMILNRQLEATRERQQLTLVFSGMLLLLAAAGGGIFFLRRQRESLAARLIEEENQNMLLQLEMKERELTTQSIHLHALGKFTEEIGNKLIGLKAQLNGEKEESLGKIIRDFEQGVSEEIWEDFRSRFERVNDDFNHKLLQLCPDLTPVELKIASYLRLNLSSKEISRLTNRSAGTISNTRSALRKKLRLEEDDNLVAYLMAL
jgi:tetratricopeptide (TPR) repeat protein